MATSVALASQSVTVAATAIGFDATAATNGVKVESALVTVETAQVRCWWDGTDPTASVGHVLDVGDSLELTSHSDCSQFRAIRTGGTSATLRVTKATSTVGT